MLLVWGAARIFASRPTAHERYAGTRPAALRVPIGSPPDSNDDVEEGE